MSDKQDGGFLVSPAMLYGYWQQRRDWRKPWTWFLRPRWVKGIMAVEAEQQDKLFMDGMTK